MAMNGPLARVAVLVQRAGQELLAGAALAEQQHGRLLGAAWWTMSIVRRHGSDVPMIAGAGAR
jgi:hypothetical protein